MSTTIGILAHVDAGKTTLAEQILYHTGVLRTAGRVDQKNAFLDHSAIERERGITVFSDQAVFEQDGKRFYLLDTPGHVDFSGEMERCLWIMDCAILVISSVEGIQSHTQTVWKMLQERKIPTILFLNKTDRVGADPKKILEGMKSRYQANCLEFTGQLDENGLSESLAELVAEQDDELLEIYFSDGYQKDVWLDKLKELFWKRKIFPVYRGSALSGDGITSLINGLKQLALSDNGDAQAPFVGKVYKVRRDKGGKVVYLKVEQGCIHPKDTIQVPAGDEMAEFEKINQLRQYQGANHTLIPEARPGDLCAITGVQRLQPGDKAGENANHEIASSLTPLLAAKVIYPATVSARTMLGYFRELEEEEPLLHVLWNEDTQEIVVHIMGEIQLEILTQRIAQQYQLAIEFGPRSILYQETIREPVVGCGHFEPLRHYAEVHVRLSPAPRGSGIHFTSECPHDQLDTNWQNLIRTHVFEKPHKGILTGSPLADVEVTLLAGKSHLKHTEGGDFRQATYRAIRQALMQAGEKNTILLEPYYSFEIEIDYTKSGRVLSDIQKMAGICNPPKDLGGQVLLTGEAPVVEMMDYPKQLTALSKGQARISLTFMGYQPCHNTQDVINQYAYEPERDLENTPDSVFCSHGAGYTVKWWDVPSHMHIKLK